MSICVAIPCHAKHLPWLSECIQSIAEQTVLPKIVSIVVAPSVSHYVKPHPPLNLTVKHVPSTIPAGRARNIAARRCGNVEFISFIDADDLMLPYYLERITHLMRTTNSTVGYHNYFQKKNSDVIVRTHADLERRIAHDRAHDIASTPFRGGLHTHHGHVTIRASHFVPQDPYMVRGQDSKYAIDLWRMRNVSFVHTTEKLTRYMQRNT
jgi:glycosyltransferase involved in cell wall biosynthesis